MENPSRKKVSQFPFFFLLIFWLPIFFVHTAFTRAVAHGSALNGVIKSAYQEKFVNDKFLIDHLELGGLKIGSNTFHARITNLTSNLLSIGLDLRAAPGMWFSPNMQKQFTFEIPPNNSRIIDGLYEFNHITPEASLRVRIGTTSLSADGGTVIAKLFERKFPVGHGNPAALKIRHIFRMLKTEHFDIYAWKGSLAESQIHQIASEREAGLRRISEILGVRFAGRIQLAFYPDADKKKEDTGHTGAGFAHDNIIVEIHNNQTHLDPFHEAAHIVAERLGSPPALFNEGFATYISERLGSMALLHLGHPEEKIDQAACNLARSGKLIPIQQLFKFEEIGSDDSRPEISYPLAASFVKYLIEVIGVERFREGYKGLVNSDDPAQIKRNEAEFVRIFGRSLAEVERAWLDRLSCLNSH